MAVGGMVPSRISDLIDSASTSASSDPQSSLPSTGPSRKTIIRQIKILMNQGRETDAVSLLRQYGISPNEVMMATGGMTPGGIVYMQKGGTAPSEEDIQRILAKPLYLRTPEEDAIIRAAGLPFQGARDLGSLLRDDARRRTTPGFESATVSFPESGEFSLQNITSSLNRNLPNVDLSMGAPSAAGTNVGTPPPAPGMTPAGSTPGGIVNTATVPPINVPTGGTNPNIMSRLESVFKPQQISQAETDLINLLKAQQQAGIPAPLDLTPFQQAAEQRQQEARDESRRMAIANTLMGLGTGLVAGDPAAGLQRATQMATETLREGRREAREEGRSAEALRLQAAQQQRQAQIEKMQFDRESLTGIANIYRDRDKSARESEERALQIMATYDAAIQNNISRLAEQGALDRRAFLSALSNAEETIEDTLAAQLTLKPEEKDRLRETLRERAIRRYGASIPGIDVEAVIKAGRAETAPAAQSGSAGGNWGELRTR